MRKVSLSTHFRKIGAEDGDRTRTGTPPKRLPLPIGLPRLYFYVKEVSWTAPVRYPCQRVLTGAASPPVGCLKRIRPLSHQPSAVDSNFGLPESFADKLLAGFSPTTLIPRASSFGNISPGRIGRLDSIMTDSAAANTSSIRVPRVGLANSCNSAMATSLRADFESGPFENALVSSWREDSYRPTTCSSQSASVRRSAIRRRASSSNWSIVTTKRGEGMGPELYSRCASIQEARVHD